MSGDQYNLSNLQNIVIPEPPPIWPFATGAWLALAMVLVILVVIAWRVHANSKRNAYRKAGLQLLRNANTVYDVSVVLKRVALAGFPREEVASLYGDDWAAFLHKTCPQHTFERVISSDAVAAPDTELAGIASAWIRHHRVPQSGTAALGN